MGLLLFLSMASLVQGDSAAKHVEEGIVHFRHGDYAEAASAFQQAHQGRPDDLRIAFDRACALAGSGSVAEAAKLFQEAAKSPEHAVAAASHYNQGNLAANKARTLFGPHPEDASAKVRQDGLALLTEALSHYDNCLAVNPDHADARYNEELIRRWIEHMQSVWREREKQSHSTSTTTVDQSKRQCESGAAAKKKPTTNPGPEQQPTPEKASANQSQAKPKEAKNPDPAKQQAEAVLRKVRERQQYRRAIERSNPQSSIRPMAVDKDW
jgi:tetratricopeptide (TPR) repeat protein